MGGRVVRTSLVSSSVLNPERDKMDKVHVIDYLRTHTFGELEAEHGVSASVSRSKPWKFSLNYSQIDSKPGPLVNQCRGLILRTHGAELPVDSKELAAICPGSVSVIARP